MHYVKSKDNIADALSLQTCQANTKASNHNEYVYPIALQAIPAAMNIQEIEKASAEDSELQTVRKCLVSWNWTDCPKSYVFVRNEVTYIGQVMLRGTRIMIPASLRKRITEFAIKAIKASSK